MRPQTDPKCWRCTTRAVAPCDPALYAAGEARPEGDGFAQLLRCYNGHTATYRLVRPHEIGEKVGERWAR